MKSVISAVCFMVALFTGVAHASNDGRIEYQVDPKGTQVEKTITKEVCTQVGTISGAIKIMFNRGMNNTDVRDALIDAAVRNMDDTDGWIAVHMMYAPDVISSMRTWQDNRGFKDIRTALPDLTETELYKAYAMSLCDNLVGTKQSVLKVNIIRVKDARP